MLLSVFLCVLTCQSLSARVISFLDLGGIPNDASEEVAWSNGAILNRSLNALLPGDEFVVPLVEEGEGVFYTMGGIVVSNVEGVVIRIDGTLKFSGYIKNWPRGPTLQRSGKFLSNDISVRGPVLACLEFQNVKDVRLTSSSNTKGVIDGSGQVWWNVPGIGYLLHSEDRPRLVTVSLSANFVLDNLLLLNSPYWTFWAYKVDGLVIHHSEIISRRTNSHFHSLYDLSAFNTDGFDFTGRNIHIYDVAIWTQDDTIAVKDQTENVLIERVNASGLGLVIGSIGDSVVRNVTFRNCNLMNSYKGIYMKFRSEGYMGLIKDVVYENIVIENNQQFPIWIGPAQQSDTNNLCYANPCSICWPMLPGASCNGVKHSVYKNITLRNVEIVNPRTSLGVILADEHSPMIDVVFDSVRVVKSRGQLDLYATFPFLSQGVSDHYVTILKGALAAAWTLAIFSGLWLCWSCTFFSKTYWHRHAKFRYVIILIGLSIMILIILIVSRVFHVNRDLQNTNKYYMCSGVSSGIATGNTYPVPPCFVDKTI